jgi:hypothetical protein
MGTLDECWGHCFFLNERPGNVRYRPMADIRVGTTIQADH